MAQRNRLRFRRAALSLRFIVSVWSGMLLRWQPQHRHDHIHRFRPVPSIVHALVRPAKCTSHSSCQSNGLVAVAVMVVDGRWPRYRRPDTERHRDPLICRYVSEDLYFSATYEHISPRKHTNRKA